MQRPNGLSIVRIHNQKTGSKDLNDEYVVILNDGNQGWELAGWEVTDETPTQRRPHIYKFPKVLAHGRTWTFEPGEAIFVNTGHGEDKFLATVGEGKRPQFHFFWNRDAFVWNNSGDRVFLRHPNGTFATEPFPVP